MIDINSFLRKIKYKCLKVNINFVRELISLNGKKQTPKRKINKYQYVTYLK